MNELCCLVFIVMVVVVVVVFILSIFNSIDGARKFFNERKKIRDKQSFEIFRNTLELCVCVYVCNRRKWKEQQRPKKKNYEKIFPWECKNTSPHVNFCKFQ